MFELSFELTFLLFLVVDGTGGQFTEDGSFIGQYVPGKLNPPVSPQPIHHQAGTSGAATYV